MTRVQLKRVDYNDGDIHRIDDVVEMEANQAAYALGMGDVIASAAAVSPPVTFPPRINNSPGARGQSKAEALLDLYGIIHGVAMNAADDSLVIRDTVTPANNYKGRLTSRLLRTGPGMMWDVNGRLVWGPENLVQRSEEFDNAVWGLTAITITPNAIIAPNGTLTADRIVETVANSKHQIAQSTPHALGIGQKFFTALHVKAGERTRIWATASSGTFGAGCLAHFDLVAGIVVSATQCLASIKPLADGWYRCIVFFTCTIATAPFTFWYLSDGTNESYVGDITKGLYIWGLHAARSDVVLDYIQTTNAAVYQARINYDPANNNEPGLLSEPQSINTCLQSNNFGTTWGQLAGSINITPGATIGPDGLSSMSLLTDNNTINSNYGVQQSGVVITPSVPNTISVFIKKKDYRYIQLNFSANNSGPHVGFYDLDTGIVSGLTSATGRMTRQGGGIWRLELTFTASASDASGPFYIIYTDTNATSAHTGVVGTGTYYFGAQCEAQPQATSYIPTGATAVTRTTDTFNLAAGTHPVSTVAQSLYAKMRAVPLLDVYAMAFGSATWGLRRPGTDGLLYNRIGGSDLGLGIMQTSITKIAGRLKSGDNAGMVTGQALTGNASLTDLSTISSRDLFIGAVSSGGLGAVQVHLFELLSTGQALANDQLQRLVA